MPDFDLVTKDNWKEYCTSNFGSFGFVGYVEANEHVVALLKNILNKTTTFEQMKTELTKLYSERKGFIDFANENLP